MDSASHKPSSGGYQRLLQVLDRKDVPPVVVASFPRSGTHLLMDTLRLNFRACQGWKLWGERLDRLYLNVDPAVEGSAELSEALVLKIFTRTTRPLVKTHTLPSLDRVVGQTAESQLDPAFTSWLRQHSKFLYCYRDGRDVMTSLHAYLQGFSPSARVPIGEFLRQKNAEGITPPRMWAEHVRSWCDLTDVYCVRMEEILDNLDMVLGGIAEALQLSFHSPARLPAITKGRAQNRWNRLFAMRPQSTAILSRRVRYPATNWRNAFSQADREFFREEVGTLLQTLGYTDSDDWVTDPHPIQP